MQSNGPPRPEPGSPDGENGDLHELRERLARLEASGYPAAPHHRWRTIWSAVLIIIASVLSILAVLAVWVSDDVTDTDRYVASVAPLARNPEVQAALTDRITAVVVRQVDVPALVGQLSQAAAQRGVPPPTASLISGLSGPIASGLTSLIHDVVHKVITSDAFATIWSDANRAAHAALQKALTGQGGGAVQLRGDQVTIDVGPIVARVKDQLVSSGFALASKIPPVHTQFVVYSSSDISKIKVYFRLLEIAGDWLPLIAVIIAAAGVLVAADRRRALIGAAVGVAAAMLLLSVAITVFRAFYLDHLPADASPGAASAAYDALVTFLRQAVRSVGVLALVVALGAFFSGPSKVAVTIRSACGSGIASVRRVTDSAGFRVGPVEPFVRRWKRWIGAVILLVAAVLFVLWSHPTGAVVLLFAVVVSGVFAVLEFLAPSMPAQVPR
jgi:hypothetical protein